MAMKGGNPANLTPGNPGNRGGRGAISSEVRKACREGFAAAVPKIIAIATDEADGATPAEMVRAFDTLGKYGMGALEAVALEKAEWLGTVCRVTAEYLPDAESYDLWFQSLMAELDSSAT